MLNDVLPNLGYALQCNVRAKFVSKVLNACVEYIFILMACLQEYLVWGLFVNATAIESRHHVLTLSAGLSRPLKILFISEI